MKTPNFFIVGAPKSGTSALAKYLGEHPHVFMCSPKEPGFYSSDIGSEPKYNSEDSYLKLFSAAREYHLAIGEASTQYLRSHAAAARIMTRYPNARLVVMLRHPIEVVQSWHSQLLLSYVEHTEDFETAWQQSIK